MESEAVTEAALVERAAAGDQHAYAELVARTSALARRTATLLGAGDDAEDVVQEAYVKAYRRLETFRGDSSFRSWLLTIVANETRNLHRTRQRRAGLLERAAVAEGPPPELDHAVDGALSTERREELVAALQQLSPADRDVLVYRYLLDMSEAETAELLDRPKGTVKSRASRALAKLRTQLIVAVLVIATVLTVVFVPPVRTAVADVVTTILRLGGVEIRQGEPAPSIAPTPSPLPTLTSGDLAQARARAAFPIGVPAVLGDPQRVELADPGPDGHPRVVTLLYPGVRLDEVDGELDLAFTKMADGVEWVGGDMIWLAKPHPLVYVDRWGTRREETARLSGPCLVWQAGSVTYRLEGVTSKEEAQRIARSVR
ncbi:RNA polymerase sigma factor (sigma-70 family) [Hamadaea flava]|uniref:RNA polymerase sigma factor n=1 Tax=Hamadaea flava TaxID=1742688 RepID=A0ABV8LWI4_9ACTN|nr:RNA polymerase sigma factor [Hamadaea flava]MCP2324686.1 RNA polymerase sigma factor (sigma-70 family) [Hamadaea flava]